jgi:hypothetical protein
MWLADDDRLGPGYVGECASALGRLPDHVGMTGRTRYWSGDEVQEEGLNVSRVGRSPLAGAAYYERLRNRSSPASSARRRPGLPARHGRRGLALHGRLAFIGKVRSTACTSTAARRGLRDLRGIISASSLPAWYARVPYGDGGRHLSEILWRTRAYRRLGTWTVFGSGRAALTIMARRSHDFKAAARIEHASSRLRGESGGSPLEPPPLAGVSPLPFENTPRSFGPGIRTWRFMWSLSRAGHECGSSLRAPGRTRTARRGGGPRRNSHRATLRRRLLRLGTVRGAVRDAARHSSGPPSSAAPHRRRESPLRSGRTSSATRWPRRRPGVRGGRNWPWRTSGTCFGRSCSRRIGSPSSGGSAAAIGELGAVGRLTAETCGYEFTAVIRARSSPGEGSAPAGDGRVSADASCQRMPSSCSGAEASTSGAAWSGRPGVGQQ